MTASPRSVRTRSGAETESLGAQLAGTLSGGDVVLLSGELGAGKTTFVRGAARALGVRAAVTSPTFTIGQRYQAAAPLLWVAHLDLYRLGSLAQEDPDLLEDYLGPQTVTFIEWPAAAERELHGTLRVARRVTLAHAGGDERVIEIS